MTYARKTLVSLNDTPYYHVVARCVRRAWLWGYDEYAGRDYSHRKEWVLERLAQLTSIFTIDICAYAVMSNHYHLVVYVDQARSQALSRGQVVERWTQLFRAPPFVERWSSGKATQAERQLAELTIDKWRKRLCDLSWFMKCLNEYLARRANIEDNCDGRFWQGRFRSQALLDEAGILTAMAYVDLNPVRAGIASTPEDSAFTSIYERIRRLKQVASEGEADASAASVALQSFSDEGGGATRIPYSFKEYLQLVDWTGTHWNTHRFLAEQPDICVRGRRLPTYICSYPGIRHRRCRHDLRPQDARVTERHALLPCRCSLCSPRMAVGL